MNYFSFFSQFRYNRESPQSIRHSMDQSVKMQELEQARRRVVEGEKTLSRQRDVVAKLETKGFDATVARQMVQSFEKIQAMNVNAVEGLRKEMQIKRNDDEIPQSKPV